MHILACYANNIRCIRRSLDSNCKLKDYLFSIHKIYIYNDALTIDEHEKHNEVVIRITKIITRTFYLYKSKVTILRQCDLYVLGRPGYNTLTQDVQV